MEEIKQILLNLGVSHSESEVYLAALKLGHQEISAIAKKAGVTRTNCYDILKRLSKRGLVRFYIKDNKKHVSVIHPDKFFEIIDEKEKLLANTKKQLDVLIPELSAYFMHEGKAPKLYFFEGIEGFLDMYYYLYKDGKGPNEALEFNSWNKDASQWFPEEREKHREMRKKKGIWVNQIVVKSSFTKGWNKSEESKKEFKRTRLIDGDIFDLGANVEIFKNKVAISNFGNKPEENQGVLIEGKEIAKLLSNIFWLAWQAAGGKNKSKK